MQVLTLTFHTEEGEMCMRIDPFFSLCPTFSPTTRPDPLLFVSFPTTHQPSRVFFTRVGSFKPPKSSSSSSPSSSALHGGAWCGSDEPSTFYELLGIPETGSVLEIKQAYEQLARKYHPASSPPGPVEEFTQRFIRVQEAYETLSDPKKRAVYDRDIAARRRHQSVDELQASTSSSSSPSAFSSGGATEDKEEEEERLAREVLLEYLEKEIGVSGEEAKQIAFNSPKYVAMLVEGVRELDQLSSSLSTDSWTTVIGDDLPPLSIKDKVYQMAKDKGDKGLLPFLESLGITLASATRIAHYLSSCSVPHLIHQVNYVRKIFFSDSNDGLLGRNARHMMIHLSIAVDEELQQTLSFFEKIQARRGGLSVLGSEDASFRYLIESFPRLLLLPLETQMEPVVEFLQEIGVPEGCQGKIFLLFPPIIFYDVVKDIKPRLMVFKKVGLKDKDLVKMLMKYPWILSTSILENYEKILDFFEKEKQVPKDSVARAIKKQPRILGSSISKLILMVKQFNDLGVESRTLSQIISRSPQLLLQRPQDFLQVIDFLQSLGLDEHIVSRVLGRCPEIFATNIDRTLKKKLEFLTGIGISRSHFPRIIRKYPEFLVCDVNKALHPRVKYLMEIGLSRRDVAFMIWRFSPLLGYSIEEVLRPKVEFLRNIMEKPLNDVVDYPRYFSYSLEKKIKPRYFLLKGRNRDCSLKDMLGKNDEEFASEFMGIERILVPPAS